MVFKDQETKPRTEADGIHRKMEGPSAAEDNYAEWSRREQKDWEEHVGWDTLYRAAEGMRKLARDRWKAMHMEAPATETNNLQLLRKGDNIIMWLSNEQSLLSHKNWKHWIWNEKKNTCYVFIGSKGEECVGKGK